MRICHPGSVGGGYLFVSRVFNPLDYSYGGAAAVVVSAKGEVVAGWRGGEGGDASESIPISHSLSPTPVQRHPYGPTTTVACCSAHVISVAGARGWPPPPLYGHTPRRHRDFDVRIRHRRAHAVSAMSPPIPPRSPFTPPYPALLRRATAALKMCVGVCCK